MAVTVDHNICIGCGCCSDVCTAGALELDSQAILYGEHCIECKMCLAMCPVAAILDR